MRHSNLRETRQVGQSMTSTICLVGMLVVFGVSAIKEYRRVLVTRPATKETRVLEVTTVLDAPKPQRPLALTGG